MAIKIEIDHPDSIFNPDPDFNNPVLPGGQNIFMRGRGGGGKGKHDNFLNEQDQEEAIKTLSRVKDILTRVEGLAGEMTRQVHQVEQIEDAKNLGKEAPKN